MSQPPLPSNGPPGPPTRRSAPTPPTQQHPHIHLSNHNALPNHHHSVSHNHHSHSSQSGLRVSNNLIHTHNVHVHHSDLDHQASLPPGRFDNIDWESKERELEEARARAAQMEKTMRWWSDCTANWREKWSKVRTERNKAREEAKMLRTKLEIALKDCSVIRREKQAIENENEFLRTEVERCQNENQETSGNHHLHHPYMGHIQDPSIKSLIDQTSRLGTPELTNAASTGISSPVKSESVSTSSPPPSLSMGCLSPRARASPTSATSPSFSLLHNESGYDLSTIDGEPQEHYGAVPKLIRSPGNQSEGENSSLGDGRSSFPGRKHHSSSIASTSDVIVVETDDVEYLQQKLTHLKMRLEEATKTIQAEREEKSHLHRSTESIQLELLDLRGRLEELKCAKQEVERLLISSQEQHRQQVVSLQQIGRDEATNRETLDRRLADLRAELERLQAENAAEWGRRERVETERQALERENKKLRATLSDLQERLEKKNNSSSSAGMSSASGNGTDGLLLDSTGKSSVHEELEERNKELLELRHAHSKLKKALQDRSVELSHGLRRAEHSEAEVRRLRSRIDELKREVAAAQDELDAATNNVRKLQRENEELQEQVDSLKIQATHLQTRLRSSSNGSTFLLHRESLLQDTLSEDEGNEF